MLIQIGDLPDPLFRIWIGTQFVVLVSDPGDIKIVMNECINRSPLYDEILDIFGEGLFNLRNAEWKERRRLLNPTLNPIQVASFQGIFNRGADRVVAELDQGKLNYLHIIDRSTLNNIFSKWLILARIFQRIGLIKDNYPQIQRWDWTCR